MTADNQNKGTSSIGRPVRQPWRPFDAETRQLFCDTLRNGCRKRSGAMRLLGLNPGVVNAWIARGRSETYLDEDYEYRHFYLCLRAAEEARDAVCDMVLAEAARGRDWRAAAELGRRQERMAVAEAQQRIAEAKAAQAEADARLARVSADLLERKLKVVAGRFVFAQEAWDNATEEERAALESLLVRRGLVRVDPGQVEEEMGQQRDPEEDAELEAMAERWGLSLDDKDK